MTPLQAVPSPSNPTKRNQRSVLIIDDHQGTLDTYSTLLRLAGFDTSTATTAQDGIDLALSRPFDVLLVDLRLPDISGTEVVRALKLKHIGARIVIVTAFPTLDSSFDAARTGADGYIDGPLFGDDVVNVCVQAVNGPLPVRLPSRQLASESTDPPNAASVLDPRIREVIRIIDADLGHCPALPELAAQVGLGESTLRHLFHASMGLSLTKFRTERRLQLAAQRLTTSHELVGHIAAEVGWQTLPEFRKAFRQRFGMSPRAYRAGWWRGWVPPY
jgi:two-component system, response regulator YesN